MKKFKLTYLVIAICGLLSASPVTAEWDGSDFDGGGDFGGDFGEGFGSDFESYDGNNFDAGYYDQGNNFEDDYYDQNDFGQNDAFYPDDEFHQQESYEFSGDPGQESNFGQTGEFNPSSNPVDNHSGQNVESAQSKEITPEPLQNNPTNAINESTTADSSVQNPEAVQESSSAQNIHIQNNIQTDQDVATNQTSDHGHSNGDHHHGHHHHGHHHHHDGFDLGFGLGLGMGLGFGFGSPFSPFWGPFYGPFAPFGSFGYYSFGYPISGFGVGFYNHYAFGPYRRFESYYPSGGYLVTAPVLTAPLALASHSSSTYIQQNRVPPARPATAQKNNYWHYCRNPEGYYPYVKQCSGEWIKVPPQPS
ncbi:hypothetical protein [Nitrosomonas sp. Nm166]|uniref:hypothetical protein n=1 Tax=Nitrosomonas sp. Nm166 TaxID=1881054 RepID=UPI0008E22FBB|nr:hypothetical protein [Nitrosomonas sp. Nm166]SFE78442.1 hypothetical protein SAMN05428977_102932 [Nitrosomonas sp. Nm166]